MGARGAGALTPGVYGTGEAPATQQDTSFYPTLTVDNATLHLLDGTDITTTITVKYSGRRIQCSLVIISWSA